MQVLVDSLTCLRTAFFGKNADKASPKLMVPSESAPLELSTNGHVGRFRQTYNFLANFCVPPLVTDRSHHRSLKRVRLFGGPKHYNFH
jgi:hypothetical protein